MAKKATQSKKFEKVLIANRGEIACRIISGCRSLGLKTVAVYSDADANAMHAQMADESIRIGAGPAAESYLVVEKIIDAAKSSGAQAIHPGYGFLSERSHFAQAVIDAGLTWIGPSPKVIDLLGNKVASKQAAEKAKVPTSPWALLPENISNEELLKKASAVGYPLLLKAAAGGGGRGMRLVHKESELIELTSAAKREALSFFGSAEIFMESYKQAARHVEVQILGDSHGNVVAFGERDCSAQRRHQKVIEEAPAPKLSTETRKVLHESAVSLGKSVGYQNAGTCEFLVDDAGKAFFLEMNTRLQVEHPVTELVWGIDLVALQVSVAQGERLPDWVHSCQPRGHAIEARIYAEDSSKGFIPSPGKLLEFDLHSGPHIRVDSGYKSGDEIPIFYDAMMAKVISWGATRDQARQQLIESLSKSRVVGVAWNGTFLKDLLSHEDFSNFNLSTKWIETTFSHWKGDVKMKPKVTEVETSHLNNSPNSAKLNSPWFYYGTSVTKSYAENSTADSNDQIQFADGGPLIAEHPGKVLSVKVKPKQKVCAGDTLVVCESMKMEFSYSAPFDTVVKTVLVSEGQIVTAGTLLVEWEEKET